MHAHSHSCMRLHALTCIAIEDLSFTSFFFFSPCIVQDNEYVLLQDFLELPMFPHEDLDACAWRDEQLQLTSSIVQHGFSIYAKDISNKGSNMGSNTKTDLSWEILACTNNMKSGKLCEQDQETTGISLTVSNILLER